ncbi:DUF3080 family protein [Halomonas sp. ML-15]|uniref:DUF3080 family protein n=1 Tax=Halomonas sp. ML-15 TaxID=2773305 RepID=UPI0017472E0E|nr:DUF3080 family protein [Halomonas sp. ML-15]MBD3896317.1 DUF3080 family protein [Halomonas sp. ML-15]
MDDGRSLVADPLRHALGWLFAVLLGSLLTGCGGSEADDLLGDYQQRLAEALDVSAPEPQAPDNIGAFPDQDLRLFKIPELRESLLNVYALRECQITSLVAERNNQLGRVAVPSQRWLYELELWRRLDACWRSDVADDLADSDRQRLQRITEAKTEHLPWASWNALFGSSEWVGNFSRASRPLPVTSQIDFDAHVAALEYLREAVLRQFDPDWQPDGSTLADHFQVLSREPLTARVLRSLMLATQRLEESNRMLASALEDIPTCQRLSDFDSSAVRRDVDDYLARLDIQAERWLTAINAVFDAHPVSRSAPEQYRDTWLAIGADNGDASAPWPRFRQAHGTHQTLLERWSTQCALTQQRQEDEQRG